MGVREGEIGFQVNWETFTRTDFICVRTCVRESKKQQGCSARGTVALALLALSPFNSIQFPQSNERVSGSK